jgi:tRNA 2-selenouridine synthase
MRAAQCIRVVLPPPLRIELLKDEYAHFLADHDALSARLVRLVPLHGKKTIARWIDAAQAGNWDELVAELLALHYDPMYLRSIGRNFPRSEDALDVAPSALTDTAFQALARELVARSPEALPA